MGVLQKEGIEDMKIKKCPYCSKRIPYISVFSSRRKAEYVCNRCGKESRVIIDKKILLAFALAVSVSLAIMSGWMLAEWSNNPLGILFVALPLVLFTLLSTKFLRFEPLKKYKKSMEARKAGIAYSDNLVTAELEEDKGSFSLPDTGSFQINSDVFNKIREERTAARAKLQNGEFISNSAKINADNMEKTSYVHVIKDVSENYSHADAPLKKIHSENSVSRTRHHIPVQTEEKEVRRTEKTDGNKYSANRKF